MQRTAARFRAPDEVTATDMLRREHVSRAAGKAARAAFLVRLPRDVVGYHGAHGGGGAQGDDGKQGDNGAQGHDDAQGDDGAHDDGALKTMTTRAKRSRSSVPQSLTSAAGARHVQRVRHARTQERKQDLPQPRACDSGRHERDGRVYFHDPDESD
jgi:hypothetical protein